MDYRDFCVLSVYFEYGIDSKREEEVYCYIEYKGFFYCLTVEKAALLRMADKLYNENWRKLENENSDFWVPIAHCVLEDEYSALGTEEIFEILDFMPDIAETSFLTQALYDRVKESEDNMGFIEIDEKEEMEEQSGKSWDVLEQELIADIEKYHLENVVEISDEPLALGYGNLQTYFKES